MCPLLLNTYLLKRGVAVLVLFSLPRGERRVGADRKPPHGPHADRGDLCGHSQKPTAGGGVAQSHVHHRRTGEKANRRHGQWAAEAACLARRLRDRGAAHPHRPEVSSHRDQLCSGGPEEDQAEAGDSAEER